MRNSATLVALHEPLIIHGDIEADSVLVFPRDQSEIGCISKLPSFGLSVPEEKYKYRLPTFRDDTLEYVDGKHPSSRLHNLPESMRNALHEPLSVLLGLEKTSD